MAAESEKPAGTEPGAPIPKDAIDPDLVKLSRGRPKIGIVTSVGMVFLCTFFFFRLRTDRHFGGESDTPRATKVEAILSGNVTAESFVEVSARPMMSHAIRTTKGKTDPGLRVAPARCTNEKLWLVLDGVGWDPPVVDGKYRGRLRALSDLPFGDVMRSYAESTARPVFATAEAIRGAANNKLHTVDGDEVQVSAGDRVAYDVIDPNQSTIIGTFTAGTPDHAPVLDVAGWQKELERIGLTVKALPQDEQDKLLGQGRFAVPLSVAAATEKLEGAKLWSARVESVTVHHQATWGELTKALDPAIDLVGVYVKRPIPDSAMALIVGEVPQDYWYILPISIVVAIIGLLFLWASIHTLRRNFLPTKT